jgi:hypothetical protein
MKVQRTITKWKRGMKLYDQHMNLEFDMNKMQICALEDQIKIKVKEFKEVLSELKKDKNNSFYSKEGFQRSNVLLEILNDTKKSRSLYETDKKLMFFLNSKNELLEKQQKSQKKQKLYQHKLSFLQ